MNRIPSASRLQITQINEKVQNGSMQNNKVRKCELVTFWQHFIPLE